FMFAGREYDVQTGLYHYLYRERDPNTGNFLSKDPLGFDDGPNVYTYVGNNPVNYIDPLGLWEVKTRRLDSKTGAKGADYFYGKNDPSGQHWQLFYNDGTNIGYLGDSGNEPNIGSDDPSGYSKNPTLKGDDDDLMREAIDEAKDYWKEQYKKGQRYNHPLFNDEKKFDCQEFIWEADRRYCQKLREKKKRCK
ncbi:MAG: RHS repeat-associated core domain-containing protein, partial [Chlamydiae bacterium]|nr:RHS repeat-associated core domain-containing protein [Chlamydiota bacterium]MBI3265992.1 RHS repeat-associated core domain-containing protein [Chlamydiota bacterium]